MVTMTSGLPGTGKSTWVKGSEISNVVCLDNIRERLNVSPTDNQGEIVQAGREEAREFMRRGEDFVWDATNLSRSLRRSVVSLFRQYDYRVRIIFFDASREIVMARNAQRSYEKRVPAKVIDKMARKIEVPTLLECDDLEIVY